MMKNWFMLICAMSFLMISCSDDDSGRNNPDEEEQTALVDKITLSFEQITTPVNNYNPGNYSVWFSMVGNKIIYANPSNTNFDQFMVAYNIGNNSFTNLLPHEEVCACGFNSKFVNDGNNLFYIANEAWRYNVSNNTWSELNYPEMAHNNNGEAGLVYQNGRIYFLGGRSSTTKFKYYDINANSWFNSTDYLYSVRTPDMVSVNNRIYALGGDSTYKRFSYFQEGVGWTTLADLTFDPRNSYLEHSVAGFGNRFIFALSGDEIHIYDTVEDKWAETSITFIQNGDYVNLFSDNNNLFIASKSDNNEFQLYKITVNMN